MLQDYDVVMDLGSGAFATVWLLMIIWASVHFSAPTACGTTL